MKYWTAVYNSRREVEYTLKLTATCEFASYDDTCAQLGDSSVFNPMLILVEPTHDELLALGNAVVFRIHQAYHAWQRPIPEDMLTPASVMVYLALSPKAWTAMCGGMKFDSRFGYPDRDCMWSVAHDCKKLSESMSNRPWNDKPITQQEMVEKAQIDYRIIRDGKELGDGHCYTCHGVLNKAAGICSPALVNCSMITWGAGMTPPAKELFLPGEYCAQSFAFKARTLDTLDTRVSAGNTRKLSDYLVVNSAKGLATKAFKSTVCPSCELYKGKCKDHSGCMLEHNTTPNFGSGRCNGPVKSSTFQPLSWHHKLTFAFSQTSIAKEVFKQLHEKGDMIGPSSTLWRKDPNLLIGLVGKQYFTVYQARETSGDPNIWELPLKYLKVLVGREAYAEIINKARRIKSTALLNLVGEYIDLAFETKKHWRDMVLPESFKFFHSKSTFVSVSVDPENLISFTYARRRYSAHASVDTVGRFFRTFPQFVHKRSNGTGGWDAKTYYGYLVAKKHKEAKEMLSALWA